MARLPQPGGDSGDWGSILNDFLSQALTSTGQIKDDAVGSAQLQDNAVTSAQLASDAVDSSVLQSGSVEAAHLADGAVTSEKIDTTNAPGSNQYLQFNGTQLTWAAGAAGVSDHGALTGLADDDHTQYLNQTRGDARYYTQAQMDTALSGKSNTSHSHAIADVTGLASSFVARVLYSSGTSSWPTRPAVTYVEWVGPVDPGILALDGDTWVDTSP